MVIVARHPFHMECVSDFPGILIRNRDDFWLTREPIEDGQIVSETLVLETLVRHPNRLEVVFSTPSDWSTLIADS